MARISRFSARRLACCAISALAVLLCAPAAQAADVCSVASAQELEAILTNAPQPVVRSGPAPDQDHDGAISTTCRFESDAAALIISVLDFPSVDEAASAFSAEVDAARSSEDRPTLTAENGLGDTAYWSTSETLMAFISKKDDRLVAVGAGGPAVKDETTLKPKLRILAKRLLDQAGQN